MKKGFESLNTVVTKFPKTEGEKEVFKSEQLKKAFDNMFITTSPEAVVDFLNDKKQMLIEVLESKQLPTELLKKKETVYISSGTDIEYPLCLGARKITMVDPVLSSEAAQNKIKNRIIALIGKMPDSYSQEGTTFKFNFGEGNEDVVVKFEPKVYDKANIFHPMKEDEYFLGNDNAMILAYRPNNVMIEDNKVRDNLSPGGVLVSDAQTMSTYEYNQERKRIINSSSELYDGEDNKKIYKKRGYEYIHLTTNSERGWGKFFLKKL